ncbi:hypothetical protein ACHAQJ_002176 [Trichoderma viride]
MGTNKSLRAYLDKSIFAAVPQYLIAIPFSQYRHYYLPMAAFDDGNISELDAFVNSLLDEASSRDIYDLFLNNEREGENYEDIFADESSWNGQGLHHNSPFSEGANGIDLDGMDISEKPDVNGNSLPNGESGRHLHNGIDLDGMDVGEEPDMNDNSLHNGESGRNLHHNSQFGEGANGIELDDVDVGGESDMNDNSLHNGESGRNLHHNSQFGEGDNSIEFNGIELDGIELDGIELDGIELDGIELDGIELDGIELDGIELDGMDVGEEPDLSNNNILPNGGSGRHLHHNSLLSADNSGLHIHHPPSAGNSVLNILNILNTLNTLNTDGLYLGDESGVYLTNGSGSNEPAQHIHHNGVLPINGLAGDTNNLSITHGTDETNDSQSASDRNIEIEPPIFDSFGNELVRWFNPNESQAHQGIPANWLVYLNVAKKVSHLRKMRPPNSSGLGSSIVTDETTLVVSIAGRYYRGRGAVWGVFFGYSSPYNIWGTVQPDLLQSLQAAEVESLRRALEVVYENFYLMDHDIRTVIIRNSSMWLTRAMTGGLELWRAGHDLPWLDGSPLLYTDELSDALDYIQNTMSKDIFPLQFKFWYTDAGSNADAMMLAQLAQEGSTRLEPRPYNAQD